MTKDHVTQIILQRLTSLEKTMHEGFVSQNAKIDTLVANFVRRDDYKENNDRINTEIVNMKKEIDDKLENKVDKGAIAGMKTSYNRIVAVVTTAIITSICILILK